MLLMKGAVKFPVIDGHIDTLLGLQYKENRLFHEQSDKGHCDLPRMREGGILASLFAVYPAKTRRSIIRGMDAWLQLVYNPINELYHIKSIKDFDIAKSENKIGAILHFEGAGGIDKEHQILRIAYHIGLRTLGLCHANINRYAAGVLFGDTKQYESGLSELGKELVIDAQSMGITIDASHLNDLSFWDLIDVTTKPIIASHSNSRAICGHLRNLTDDQLRVIHEKRGTVGINFGAMFLDSTVTKETKDNLTLENFKKHIDHIVEVTDINTVAIGSDFDGTMVPNCMKDVTYLPKLWDYLLENGYTKPDLEKISHTNLIRVFKDTWKV
jgi:membrane dipeptidase